MAALPSSLGTPRSDSAGADGTDEIRELTLDNNSYRAPIGGAGDVIAEPRNQHTPLFLRAFFDMVRSFR